VKHQRYERTEDVAEWYELAFVDVVSDPNVRALARRDATRLASPEGPFPEAADFEAARPYLRKCMDNMSVAELEELTDEQAAALWARGACGAARFRKQGGRHERPRHTGRARNRPRSKQGSRKENEREE
jgi:hypothetical protein